MIGFNSRRISVVVAVYNGGKTLQRCISSFISQSYQNKELIVIDGASTDNSVEIIRNNVIDIFFWESKPDRGIYHAWNKALEHVTGDWICFLGSDDYFWKDDVLEQMVLYLAEVGPKVNVVYGQLASVNSSGDMLRIIGDPWQIAKARFFDHMSIPHSGLMHRHSLFHEHGQFDESFRIAGDYEFLLRELRSANALFIPDIITVGMQYGGISCDSRFLLKILLEEARARRKNNIRSISLQWIRAIIKTVLRTAISRIMGEKAVRFLAIIFGRLIGRPSTWEKSPIAAKSRQSDF